MSAPVASRAEGLSLADLEAIRLVLRGGSVIDWHRLNFADADEVSAFLGAHSLDPSRPADRARAEAVKNSAISYLRRFFDFPIPKAVAEKDVAALLLLASSRGHRQLCACTILKVMHIIHHLEARELLFMLPMSDQELFHLMEQKVYRMVGAMLAQGFPILEFTGGRKNKDSLYTKLLSKPETHAAQIYDKLRFRIVTRGPEDIFPTLKHLMRRVFPFNYGVPLESTNTLLHFRAHCEAHPDLARLLPGLQLDLSVEEGDRPNVDNRFTSPRYRVIHFVVDMPVRVPPEVMDQAPPAAWSLGPIVFGQTEFQILDRATERENERGEASHEAYKRRQHAAVARRLKMGRSS
ncbi:MAG: TIGR04552 family protein [Sandaracinaceae bacterium]